jgi:hypothetical protein
MCYLCNTHTHIYIHIYTHIYIHLFEKTYSLIFGRSARHNEVDDRLSRAIIHDLSIGTYNCERASCRLYIPFSKAFPSFIHMCICIYIYVCMYVYIYMYIYIHPFEETYSLIIGRSHRTIGG